MNFKIPWAGLSFLLTWYGIRSYSGLTFVGELPILVGLLFLTENLYQFYLQYRSDRA
jgi:hypothetical protein